MLLGHLVLNIITLFMNNKKKKTMASSVALKIVRVIIWRRNSLFSSGWPNPDSKNLFVFSGIQNAFGPQHVTNGNDEFLKILKIRYWCGIILWVVFPMRAMWKQWVLRLWAARLVNERWMMFEHKETQRWNENDECWLVWAFVWDIMAQNEFENKKT